LLQDHIELRIIPGSNGLVNADPVQVEQVILNLAINAGCLMELGLAHTVVGANEPPLEVANGAIGKGDGGLCTFSRGRESFQVAIRPASKRLAFGCRAHARDHVQ
jgi:hypothetical protein